MKSRRTSSEGGGYVAGALRKSSVRVALVVCLCSGPAWASSSGGLSDSNEIAKIERRVQQDDSTLAEIRAGLGDLEQVMHAANLGDTAELKEAIDKARVEVADLARSAQELEDDIRAMKAVLGSGTSGSSNPPAASSRKLEDLNKEWAELSQRLAELEAAKERGHDGAVPVGDKSPIFVTIVNGGVAPLEDKRYYREVSGGYLRVREGETDAQAIAEEGCLAALLSGMDAHRQYISLGVANDNASIAAYRRVLGHLHGQGVASRWTPISGTEFVGVGPSTDPTSPPLDPGARNPQ